MTGVTAAALLADAEFAAAVAAFNASLVALTAELTNITGATALRVDVEVNGEPIFSQGFGTVDPSQPTRPPDGATLFRIGSISKLFAFLAFADAADAGILNVHTPVSSVVPGFAPEPPLGYHVQMDAVRFHDLLTHVSGLPREAPCVFGSLPGPPCASSSTATIAASLRDIPLLTPPGLRPAYSNLGFALLGNAAAEVAPPPAGAGRLSGGGSGSAFDLWFQRWSARAGVVRVGFDIPPALQSAFATPMSSPGVPLDPSAAFVDLGWAWPAGQAWAAGPELARVGSMFAQWWAATRGDDPLGLRAESLRASWVDDAGGDGAPGATGFGYAWELHARPGGAGVVRVKAGNIPGYSAGLAVVPELGLAASFLVNGGWDGGASSQFLAPLLVALRAAASRVVPPPVRSPDLPALVGPYLGPGGLRLTVTAPAGAEGYILVSPLAGYFSLTARWAPSSEDVPGTRVSYTVAVPPAAAQQLPDCFELELLAILGEPLLFERAAADQPWVLIAPGLAFGYRYTHE